MFPSPVYRCCRYCNVSRRCKCKTAGLYWKEKKSAKICFSLGCRQALRIIDKHFFEHFTVRKPIRIWRHFHNFMWSTMGRRFLFFVCFHLLQSWPSHCSWVLFPFLSLNIRLIQVMGTFPFVKLGFPSLLGPQAIPLYSFSFCSIFYIAHFPLWG